MRFDYDPPTLVLIIANGLSLLYYDEELKEATFMPLWKTPLWFLIREEVRFDDHVEIVAIAEALGTLRITLRYRSEERSVGTGCVSKSRSRWSQHNKNKNQKKN